MDKNCGGCLTGQYSFSQNLFFWLCWTLDNRRLTPAQSMYNVNVVHVPVGLTETKSSTEIAWRNQGRTRAYAITERKQNLLCEGEK